MIVSITTYSITTLSTMTPSITIAKCCQTWHDDTQHNETNQHNNETKRDTQHFVSFMPRFIVLSWLSLCWLSLRRASRRRFVRWYCDFLVTVFPLRDCRRKSSKLTYSGKQHSLQTLSLITPWTSLLAVTIEIRLECRCLQKYFHIWR
jgi:hypothetical protein